MHQQQRKSVYPISINLSPEEVAGRLQHRNGMVFLDSSLESSSAISLIATDPDCIIEGKRDDWPELVRALEQRSRVTLDHGLPAGAAMGWTAYDGSFRYGFYENLLGFVHATGQWFAYGHPVLPDDSEEIPSLESASAPNFQPELRQEQFEDMVRRAKSWIAAGDIYQVCLSHRFSSPWQGSAWEFYKHLRRVSPAPYAAYLNLGGTQVLSASPECFLHISGNKIHTRPIKGTRPRRADPAADERSACELVTSAKEIAELVMITDLERNDLGRICEYGSVRVTDLLRLETFEQVFHLVSTIEGTLRDGIGHATAAGICSPGGSISGAPKVRACEIIAALEPAPRGIYTGSIGFFGFNAESRLNIAIRTVVVDRGMATFHAGAGIVADSNPTHEWQETLDKAAGMLAAAHNLSFSPGSIPHRAPLEKFQKC